MGYCLKDGEDLMAFRMSPPAPLNRLVDDRLCQPRNRTFGRGENYAVLFDKEDCFIGGHTAPHYARLSIYYFWIVTLFPRKRCVSPSHQLSVEPIYHSAKAPIVRQSPLAGKFHSKMAELYLLLSRCIHAQHLLRRFVGYLAKKSQRSDFHDRACSAS